MAIITLTTDFGPADHYVAAMKGVILSRVPDCRIIDATHQIKPQDVKQAALVLGQLAPYYPAGTVHVAVVDPGVGGERSILAGIFDDQVFVAPDNGVLTFVEAHCTRRELRHVRNEDWFRRPVSATFHGRDIFAPVAAMLADGAPIAEVGPVADRMTLLKWDPPVLLLDGSLQGAVIQVDAFGNLITNLSHAELARHPRAAGGMVRLGQRPIGRIMHHYGEVPEGRPIALLGSSDLLEISVNCGSAAKVFGVGVDQVVTVGPEAAT